MLLTKKSEYALLSLIIIAQNKNPQNVEVLSRHLNISKSFLAKILQTLAKHNVLTSYKGANGGFLLTKKPDELTIYDIVKISEAKIPAVFECSTGTHTCDANLTGSCTLFPMLNTLQYKINDFLKQLTLKDILQ